MARPTTNRKGLTMCKPTNPVVRVSRDLQYLPGWIIREYADGMFDARSNAPVALSPGLDSWQAAFDWAWQQDGNARYAEYRRQVDR